MLCGAQRFALKAGCASPTILSSASSSSFSGVAAPAAHTVGEAEFSARLAGKLPLDACPSSPLPVWPAGGACPGRGWGEGEALRGAKRHTRAALCLGQTN